MPHGAGKYDNLASMVRTAANAEAVVLIVFGGSLGTGFSVQTIAAEYLARLPGVLREVAGDIEKEGPPPEGSAIPVQRPTPPPPVIFKKGERVRIGYAGRTVDGVIVIASSNGLAIGVEFEAILGGFVGAMGIGWDGSTYRDIFFAELVTLERVP